MANVAVVGEDVESWIARSLAGDQAAWMRLLGQLWEQVDRRVRNSRSMGQLRGNADDRREAVSRVFARLHRDDFRALRLFSGWRDRHPEKTFDDWLTIVVTNVIRDYVSVRLGATDASGVSLKRLVNTLADSLDEELSTGARPAMTNTIAAAELMELAKALLPDEQCSALASWLEGNEFDEIATAHAWADPAMARAKVRAALARLRREVRDPESTT